MNLPFLPKPPRIAVIRLQGMIAAGGRGGLSDAALSPVLERAFRKGKPAAVALAVNSPGGSAAQSSLIAARIRQLSEKHGIAVHAFVEDVAASGGYWLATAADHIWADDSSVLGSIGVIAAGFGFPELMQRHGIERRVHTAGRSKSFLDPFRPEKPEDVERLRAILSPIHDAFIAQVKTRRGSRLKDDADLFNGDVWVGAQAVAVGLADGVAHLEPKMRALYGDKAQFIPYGPRRSLAQRFGMQVAGAVIDAAEERALWARHGV